MDLINLAERAILPDWLIRLGSCYWPTPHTTLAEAEEAMIDLFCRRAGIVDGMQILELGCGWGSLCLWIAEKHAGCRILAVTNSRTQREFIVARCAVMRLQNVEVVMANVADFATTRRFDRVVSVEMFEHVRNYEELFRRIAGWLLPDGKLMVHIFRHRQFAHHNGNEWFVSHYLFSKHPDSTDQG
jgi:cyclopropane-fatty-acyl-phospholipid synthase